MVRREVACEVRGEVRGGVRGNVRSNVRLFISFPLVWVSWVARPWESGSQDVNGIEDWARRGG